MEVNFRRTYFDTNHQVVAGISAQYFSERDLFTPITRNLDYKQFVRRRRPRLAKLQKRLLIKVSNVLAPKQSYGSTVLAGNIARISFNSNNLFTNKFLPPFKKAL